ncbi:MAG: ADP-glyceromanno-heptose 6-epimerase [Candidatus Pacearchaeota archaeon]
MKHTYLITGGAGLIGSNLVMELNQSGETEIYIVDHLGTSEKWKNLRNLDFADYFEKDVFYKTLKETPDSLPKFTHIVHLGACSSTTEKDADYLMSNNFKFSKKLYDWCYNNNCRLIYASSAAVYGDGYLKYDDSKTNEYKPLNMYGYTKKLFDQYVINCIENKKILKQCVGLRFFNVYGPNEYHKSSMASVIFQSFNQIMKDKKVKLFKSYKEGVGHGEQKRDFVYIKDVVNVVTFMVKNKKINGIFNIGTSIARSYNDLAKNVFKSLNISPNIEYVDMPEELRKKYQYFSRADIKKLRKVGYKKKFFSLEKGIHDYVTNYLVRDYKNF